MENIKSLEPVWAYALFGWLLGTLPPATVFTASAFLNPAHVEQNSSVPEISGIFVLIVGLCSFTGLLMGAGIGLLSRQLRDKSWILFVALAPIFGAVWGAVTGGAGGFPVFIVGAIFGAIYAAPFGIAGFPLFAAIYEPLARRDKLASWLVAVIASIIPVLLTLGVFLWLFRG